VRISQANALAVEGAHLDHLAHFVEPRPPHLRQHIQKRQNLLAIAKRSKCEFTNK